MGSLKDDLSERTSLFGLKLYAVIGIGAGALVLFILVLGSLVYCLKSSRKRVRQQQMRKKVPLLPSSGGSMMIIKAPKKKKSSTMDQERKPISQRLLLEAPASFSSSTMSELDKTIEKEVMHISSRELVGRGFSSREFEIGVPIAGSKQKEKEKEEEEEEVAVSIEAGPNETGGAPENIKLTGPKSCSTTGESRLTATDKGAGMDEVIAGKRLEEGSRYYRSERGSEFGSIDSSSGAAGAVYTAAPSPSPSLQGPEASAHPGWGHWYTLRELELATNSFSAANVLGEGGYGIVYHGILPDGTRLAVKNLLNNKGQAEREFKVEVEAMGRVRHKNLVRLLGYCMEGSQRMLVYEYIDNGNVEQWLHGQLGESQPMSWDVRLKVIIGTAKGVAYLHEGLEPKVVHRDIKSSNILLDSQWNPKVSDFGLAKLLGAGNSHITTRVMGTFGYVAPEYASTGLLNEKSDIYSYGVLLMELITGRDPVDYSRPGGEVNLVEWMKMMVGSRLSEEVVDPRMEVAPSPRALKRALLVALRCVDPDSQKRPKMSQIVHMLEADDNPFREERKVSRKSPWAKSNPHHLQTILQTQGISLDSSTYTASRRDPSGRSQRSTLADSD